MNRAVRRSALTAAAIVGAGLIGAPIAKADSTGSITASITTKSPQVGRQLEGNGQVSNVVPQPTSVSITRQDPADSAPKPITDSPVPVNSDDGTFTFTDTPVVRGSTTYTFTVEGASPAQVTTTVAGNPVKLSLSTARRSVAAGRHVAVTAHLSGAPGATVTLYATPYQQSKRQIGSGPVDGKGERSASATVHGRTVFSVRYAGDDTHEPASATLLVRASATITESLHGGYGTRHHVRLYHAGSQPLLIARRLPAARSACLYFRAEHYYTGAWHTSTVSHCIRTDAQGYAAGALTGSHVLGEPYRIRAEWRGSKALLAHAGAWLRLEFRR